METAGRLGYCTEVTSIRKGRYLSNDVCWRSHVVPPCHVSLPMEEER